MPLYIEEKRVHSKTAYENHKSMMRSLTELQRLVRGGHPEYKNQVSELKKKIAVNKLLA